MRLPIGCSYTTNLVSSSDMVFLPTNDVLPYTYKCSLLATVEVPGVVRFWTTEGYLYIRIGSWVHMKTSSLRARD